MKILTGGKKDLVLIISILILIGLINLSLFKVPFLYDDFDFLFNWAAIRDFNHIPSLLFGETPVGHEGVYRPMRGIFYVLSYHFAGTNIFFYHLQELAVYFLCIIFAYLITQQMFKKRLLSFFTALIYALLPIHIDNVANLTASFDTIGAVFFFISFFLFQKYLEAQKKAKRVFLVFSLLASFFAYTTYEITLILPLVIFLYVFFKGKRLSFGVYFAYIMLLFCYLFIRIDLLDISTRGAIGDNFGVKIANTAKDFMGYLAITIFPIKVSAPSLYGETGILLFSKSKEAFGSGSSPSQFLLYFISFVSLITIAVLGVRSYLRRQINGFGIGWFFVCLLPAAAISLQSGALREAQILWGRYAIIASFGIALLIANLMLKLFKFRPKNQALQYFRIMGICAVITLLFLNGMISRNNLNHWQDPRPDLLGQIRQEHEGEEKHNDLGVIYAMYYRYADSVAEFQEALKINPKYTRAEKNLANVCKIIKNSPKNTWENSRESLRECEGFKF